jgi:hypothetical protein
MATPTTKPYVKLAGGLVLIGGGLLTIERLGLSNLSGPNHTGVHIDGTILSLLVIVPAALIVAGCIVFMVGKMRRL